MFGLGKEKIDFSHGALFCVGNIWSTKKILRRIWDEAALDKLPDFKENEHIHYQIVQGAPVNEHGGWIKFKSINATQSKIHYHITFSPKIKGTGFVLQSLEAALWAFHTTNNFKEGALRAVNLGDDADTTGAVYGQIAGSYYGIDNIPRKWVEIIYMKENIIELSNKLNSFP